MPADIRNVVGALGNSRPPAELTQPPFHFDETRFRRLCSPGAVPDENDLYYYVIDLNYVEIQADLLAFLLPDYLCVWQKDLMASHTSDNAGLVEYFSGALAKRSGFRDCLSFAQYRAVAEFMRDAILDKIDKERRRISRRRGHRCKVCG